VNGASPSALLVGRILLAGRRRLRTLGRFESAFLLSRAASVGAGCTVGARLQVDGPERLILGTNVHIGDGAFIKAGGGLRIGDNTHISRNVTIYTTSHRYDGTALPYDDHVEEKPVSIGRNCWIGMNVSIAPGTTIGDGAIIGLGCSVAGDIPSLAIVGNPPVRVLKERDGDHYEELDRRGSYGGPNGVRFDPGGSPTT
jgi:acetyltransferase-like isoleucine patch superfamily enzyme